MKKPTTRRWLFDHTLGAIAGAVAGAVIAVNIIIFSGISQRYETTIPQVFDESPTVGVIVLAMLIGGPVVGVYLASKFRSGR